MTSAPATHPSVHAGGVRPRGSRIAYVIGTYPVPTTTFIDREIGALRRLGVAVRVVSLRPPPAGLSAAQRRLVSEVRYVLPASAGAVLASQVRFLVTRPAAYWGTLVRLLSSPHPTARARLRTLPHFGLGVHVARLLGDPDPIDHIHAHFADRAAVVALVAGRLLDTPFSVTAHANDIYVNPVLLPEKLSAAKFAVTCTRANQRHLAAVLSDDPDGRVRCIHHGLDLSEYTPGPPPARMRPLLLAVAQLKEKKGLGHLVEACRLLRDRGIDVDCEIVGDGPLRTALESAIRERSLEPRVSLLGALPHDAVVGKYREASVFVLPCVVGSDGDRDGIPNVILEAMAMRLPVVSTRHSGIPEAVEDGASGLLVPPGDPAALADALERLIADDDLRARLGRRARQRVGEAFDLRTNVAALLAEVVA